MCYLLQEQIIDDFAHNTWKTATPPTAIQRFVLTSLLLINNFFTLTKKVTKM